jgi:hypothetical protein
MTCPVTKKDYIRRLESFEDLPEIPGFWQAVASAFGSGAWLRKLVSSPKARTAALISAI